MPNITQRIGKNEFLRKPLIPVPEFAQKFLEVADEIGFCAEQSWGGRLWDVGTVNLFHPDWPGPASPQLIACWNVIQEGEWKFTRCTMYTGATNRRTVVHTEEDAEVILALFTGSFSGKVKKWISPRSL